MWKRLHPARIRDSEKKTKDAQEVSKQDEKNKSVKVKKCHLSKGKEKHFGDIRKKTVW